MADGDHIYVPRGLYTHHGIDAGDGTAIHFAGEPGRRMHDALVVRSPLELFLRGGTLHVRRHPPASVAAPAIVLARAESHLGEGGYDLFRNNCEHFATWCVTGRPASTQVRIDVASTALAAAGLLVGTTLWARQRA